MAVSETRRKLIYTLHDYNNFVIYIPICRYIVFRLNCSNYATLFSAAEAQVVNWRPVFLLVDRIVFTIALPSITSMHRCSV